MITYQTEFNVYLDGRKVGVIREEYDAKPERPTVNGLPGPVLGYRYTPKNGKGLSGERYSTLAACKQSLENE